MSQAKKKGIHKTAYASMVVLTTKTIMGGVGPLENPPSEKCVLRTVIYST